jgi:hypothetical protein
MSVPKRSRDFDRQRCRRVPRLESLEGRELLTFTLIHQANITGPRTLAGLASRASALAKASGSASTPQTGDTTGTLTPHEVRRQSFVARFKGDYLVGPGRTTDQAAQLTSLGYGGGNQSFHWWSNMRIVLPKDPNAPVTGVIYIVSWNVGTSGTQLFLDLTGDPSSEVHGLPTHYTWTVDPASSGIYSGAAGYGTGQGTLDIKFFPEGRAQAPASQKGQLQFSVNGLIDTSGNFNVLGVLGNIPTRP